MNKDLLHLKLIDLIGNENVKFNDAALFQHGKDESYHKAHSPDIVCFPEDKLQVTKIMELANEFNVPVTPFGYGSGLEGSSIPTQAGISINFQNMNQILEVKEEDLLVTVQPGVTRTALNKELKKYGMFFPVDPGADATIGGMTATNASGTTSVKYGIMRDQVRRLEVVTSQGETIRTGSLAAKSSSGYDLNGLFVGSEGTLGIFTEITLKIYGIPEDIRAVRAEFSSIQDAVDSVVSLIYAGVSLARIELVDEAILQEINKFSETEYHETPTLFIELHGNQAGLNQDMIFLQDILKEHDCQGIVFEKETAKRNKLWEARHNAAYAFKHNHPGQEQMITDVCLPISNLAEAIEHAKEGINATDLVAGIVGHVGDGNYHIFIMLDINNPEEVHQANALNEQIVEFSLKHGGTCTGEHGVGIGKIKYQQQEHGLSLKYMKKLKESFNPKNILNPGKIFE